MKTLIIRSAARLDILSNGLFFAEHRTPETAERFHTAVERATQQIREMPGLGSPRETTNPILLGLRSFPLEGFDAIRLYYLEGATAITVVRVLHGSRDVLKLLDEESS